MLLSEAAFEHWIDSGAGLVSLGSEGCLKEALNIAEGLFLLTSAATTWVVQRPNIHTFLTANFSLQECLL